MNYSENEQKYYLASVAFDRAGKSGALDLVNVALVGVVPTTWLILKNMEGSSCTLINFWEISEAEFSSLDHEYQDSAWAAYERYGDK
jgi:hypothetical protein